MANITIDLPDDVRDWIESDILRGGAQYDSVEAYLVDLIGWDRAAREPEFTEVSLRAHLDGSRASGISSRTSDEIFADACERARARSEHRG
jgi:antitoxin ParD1/3/4